MIKIFMLILRGIKLSGVASRYIGKLLLYIWSFLKKISTNPALFWIVAFYPIIEIIIMALTGWNGFISPMINSAIAYIFGMIAEKMIPDFNLNDTYSSLPERALQISAYIGLTGAIQEFINGSVQFVILFINLKMSIYLYKLKFALRTKMLKSRGGYL